MERYIYKELIHYLLNSTPINIVTLSIFTLPVIFLLRKSHIIFIHARERSEIEKLFMTKDEFNWHKFIQMIIYNTGFIVFLFIYAGILSTMPWVQYYKIRLITILGITFALSSLVLVINYIYKKFFSLSNNSLNHNNKSPTKNAKKLLFYVLFTQAISCIFLFVFIFEDLLFHSTYELKVKLLPFFVIMLVMLIRLFIKTSSFITNKKYKYKIVMRLPDLDKIKDKLLFSHYTINQRFVVLSEHEEEWASNHYYVYDLNQNRYLEINKVPCFNKNQEPKY
jgi:magnesium-transporting ATPase (P-type)